MVSPRPGCCVCHVFDPVLQWLFLQLSSQLVCKVERLWITTLGLCSFHKEESSLLGSCNYHINMFPNEKSRCRRTFSFLMKVSISFNLHIKYYIKGLASLGSLHQSLPSYFLQSFAIIASLSRPEIASVQCTTVCTRRAQCMTLDQWEGAIPKVYLLWLEPGHWRDIKVMRLQLADSLWAPSHTARAGYHLPETGSLKAKSPPPKGKEAIIALGMFNLNV